MNGALHDKLDHAAESRAIREEMARVRSRLHSDVEATKTQLTRAFEWRSYVESYPLMSIGAAAAIGFFLAPRGRQTVELSDKQAAQFSRLASATSAQGASDTRSLSPWSGLLVAAGAAAVKTTLGMVAERVLLPAVASAAQASRKQSDAATSTSPSRDEAPR